MYIKVPINMLQSPIIKDAECMNTFLCLYATCLNPNRYTPFSKAIQLAKDEVIATKSFLSKSLNCSENLAQSYIKRLKSFGLISIRHYNATRHNIIRINTINSQDNSPYIKIDIPGNALDYLRQKSRNIFKVYLNLALMANQKETEDVFTGLKIHRGELFSSLRVLAEHIQCSIQELRTAFNKLITAGGIIVEGIKRIGLKIKMSLFPKVRETKKEQDTTTLPYRIPTSQEDGITLAIRKLYFDLKHNKDKEKFENLSNYIHTHLPSDFPLEKMDKALTDYYTLTGGNNSPILKGEDIIAYLHKYNNTYQASVKETKRQEALEQRKKEEIETIGNEYKQRLRLWDQSQELFSQLKSNGPVQAGETTIETCNFLLGTGLRNVPEQYLDRNDLIAQFSNTPSLEQLNNFFSKIDNEYFNQGKAQSTEEYEHIKKAIETYNGLGPIKFASPHSIMLYNRAIVRVEELDKSFAATFMHEPAAQLLRLAKNDEMVSEIEISVANTFVQEQWYNNQEVIKDAFLQVFGKFTIKLITKN